MKKELGLISLVLFLLCVISVSAATISGTIYDLSLNKVLNVIVMVDSKPTQRYLSTDGTYSFTLEPGKYTITSRFIENNLTTLISRDVVEIKSEGDFVYDIFLFPSFDDEEELFNSTDIDLTPGTFEEKKTNYFYYITPVIIILLIVIAFIIKKRPKKEISEDEDLNKVVEVIKKQGGRTTQKEIRKEIPLSEAKISLMIAELEEKGILKKIKKGRGNIIILQKK